MKFELCHPFHCSAERAWELLFSAEYEVAVFEDTGVTKTLLDEGERDGRPMRRFHVDTGKPLPKAAAKVIGAPNLTYDVTETYDIPGRTMHWSVVPSALADKITAGGTWALVDTPDGCERLVRGQIGVAIPLIGGKIERTIGAELRASYERSYDFALEWIKENA